MKIPLHAFCVKRKKHSTQCMVGMLAFTIIVVVKLVVMLAIHRFKKKNASILQMKVIMRCQKQIIRLGGDYK